MNVPKNRKIPPKTRCHRGRLTLSRPANARESPQRAYGSPQMMFLRGSPENRCHAPAHSRLHNHRRRSNPIHCIQMFIRVRQPGRISVVLSISKWAKSIPPLQEFGRRKPISERPHARRANGLRSSTWPGMVMRIPAVEATPVAWLPDVSQREHGMLRSVETERWTNP